MKRYGKKELASGVLSGLRAYTHEQSEGVGADGELRTFNATNVTEAFMEDGKFDLEGMLGSQKARDILMELEPEFGYLTVPRKSTDSKTGEVRDGYNRDQAEYITRVLASNYGFEGQLRITKFGGKSFAFEFGGQPPLEGTARFRPPKERATVRTTIEAPGQNKETSKALPF